MQDKGLLDLLGKIQQKRKQDRSDHEKLTAWVKTLPYGTFIRHHVAGDIGK